MTMNCRKQVALFAGILLAISLASCTSSSGTATRPDPETRDTEGIKVLCPVSGEKFGPPREARSTVYKGETYFFCCPQCKDDFDKNPDHYIRR